MRKRPTKQGNVYITQPAAIQPHKQKAAYQNRKGHKGDERMGKNML
jgi:hypothetical protein